MKQPSFFRYLPLLFLVILLLPSCGKEKTERELYEEVRSSFKYKTYKALSEKLTYDMIQVQGVPMKAKEGDELYMRLLLGYNWAIAKKDAFAFAESDIVNDRTKKPSEKFLAHSINAITMYENGWLELAKEESALANSAVNKSPGNDTIRTQVAIFHLIMGTLSIKDKNFDAARFHFAGFGQVTNIHWPHHLVDAMADIQNGDVQTGLKKLKRMAEDPAVPAEIRIILANGIAEVEKNTGGDVDSSLFWPRAISGILLDQLKNSGIKELENAGQQLDKLRDKLNI